MRTTKEVFGHRELWAAALLVVSAGCTADIGKGGGAGGTIAGAGAGGPPGGASNTPGSPGGPVGTTGNPAGPPGTTAPAMTGAAGTIGNVPAGPLDTGRVAMRRLNDREYDNTMRDLLGTKQTLAATTFPGDNVDDGFDTVGSALSYSDKLLAQQFAASTTLVNELVARTATDPLKTAVFVCTPTAATMATCLPQMLTTFMPKAWRRTVTAAEIATAAAVGTTVLASAQSSTATGGADPATTEKNELNKQ